MGQIDERLKQLGITLPDPPKVPPYIVPAVRTGNLVFLSGAPPVRPDGTWYKGKLGHDMTTEEGAEAARACGLALLANLKAEIGDLDKVKRVVKLLGMVNSAPDFIEQAEVMKGCSSLLVNVFGEKKGLHARSATGMGAMPVGIPLEVEMIVEVEG